MTISRPTRSEEVEQLLFGTLEELADAEGRLPPEIDLATKFNVSRGTIRTAVGSLVARSLLVRRQGKGTYLNRMARIGNPLDEALDFCEIIAKNGHEPGMRHVHTSISLPELHVAEALGLDNQPALHRHTVFTANGNPVIYCIDVLPLWVLPASLAAEVVADPAISEPIYDFLESRAGQRIDFHTASIWPDIAQNCAMLEKICEPLTPVLVIEETGLDLTRRPILHSIEYYPGRFMHFELVRRRAPRSDK